MRIDLHTHSTESDGILAPAGLVRRAAEAGLAAIALIIGGCEACDEKTAISLTVESGRFYLNEDGEIRIALKVSQSRDDPELDQLGCHLRRTIGLDPDAMWSIVHEVADGPEVALGRQPPPRDHEDPRPEPLHLFENPSAQLLAAHPLAPLEDPAEAGLAEELGPLVHGLRQPVGWRPLSEVDDRSSGCGRHTV